MAIGSACVMVPPSPFGLYVEIQSVRKTPALAKRKTQRHALYSVDETRADISQLFMNLFRITDRKLGSGAYGEVWMAVDVARKRQMACKLVKLEKSPQKRSGRVSFSEPLWREVELLRDISHVRKEAFGVVDLRSSDIFSQTLYTSSVYSLPRITCMKLSPMSVFELKYL